MAKEDVTRSGQAWLDNLAKGNYVAAQEHFPKLVKASFEGLLNTRSQEFIKQFTEKLRNNSKK